MTTHSTKDRPRHLNVALEEDLQALKERVRLMGQVVDAQVAAAVHAFSCRDTIAAAAVTVGDQRVNELERAIDAHCVRILALYQPVASDLRFVAAVLKIVTDLERIGDFAVNIAKAVEGSGAGTLGLEQELPSLLAGALGVLRRALAAFLLRNEAEAELASGADASVTASVSRLGAELHDEIRREPSLLENALALLFVSKHLERIAEHATNIAEMALYTQRGEDVRHLALP